LGSPTSNTDQLIERLVADATPVRRLVDPRRRAALWMAIALVCTGLGVAHYGVRRDIAGAMTWVPFLLRVGLLAATMWLSVVAAFRLAVPGEDGYILDLDDVNGATYRSHRGIEQHSAK